MRDDLGPGHCVGRLRMTRGALAALADVVDVEEIGVAFFIGRADPDGWSIRSVERVPNLADERYPHKARGDLRPRQSAWAYDPEVRATLEARAAELGAIIHGHSGLVTLYRRGTIKAPGAIVYRGRAASWPTSHRAFCAKPADLPASLADYPQIERCSLW